MRGEDVAAVRRMYPEYPDLVDADDPPRVRVLRGAELRKVLDQRERARRADIDLLEAGHFPSRRMMRMIIDELKEKWWPDPELRTNEALFLYAVGAFRKLRAAKYKDAKVRDASKKAEEDAAKAFSLRSVKDVVEALRKRCYKSARIEARGRIRPLI